MNTRYLLPALALLPLLLPACKPSVSSLRHISFKAEHLGDDGERTDDECASLHEEARELVNGYLQSPDAQLASPRHHLTMLHLAAQTHRYWLVLKLLNEGANPNAVPLSSKQTPGDTPAIMAVRQVGKYSSKHGELQPQDALFIINALITKGANINQPGVGGQHILTRCHDTASTIYRNRESERLDTDEKLALELMKLGARVRVEDAPQYVSYGWGKVMEALLATPEAPRVKEQLPALLCEAAKAFSPLSGERDQTALLDCVKLLLSHATADDVRGTQGMSPLYILAQQSANVSVFAGRRMKSSHSSLKRATDEDRSQELTEKQQRYLEFATLLLRHGADPLLPGGKTGKTCAADLMVATPWVTEELAKLGFTISAPLHHFTPEALAEQLLEIPAQSIRAEEIREQFDTISGIFSASPAHLAPRSYREACTHALALLHGVDAPRTQRMLMALPAWHEVTAWEGDALELSRGLLNALQETEAVILPKEQLVTTARRLAEAGKPGPAHALIRLLARDASAAALVEQLCDEGTPLPLRAAAWSCKLEMDRPATASEPRLNCGLPSLGKVKEWLREKQYIYRVDSKREYPTLYTALVAEDAKATLSRKPEHLYYEGRLEEENGIRCYEDHEALLQALKTIGAPLAAELNGGEAAGELPAELTELNNRHGIHVAASLEVELALSRYIWEHREHFREPRIHRNK